MKEEERMGKDGAGKGKLKRESKKKRDSKQNKKRLSEKK